MHHRRGFYLGLALITLVTLTLEVVNARLFSVITWYHLSFLAISIAMLGMTAGGLYVYLRPACFADDRVLRQLIKHSLFFAISVPLCHFMTIHYRPIQDTLSITHFLLMTATAAVPFFFSGVVVAASLTRVALPIGRIYFVDLMGAALGCLGGILLLQATDPSSGSFLMGALAAVGAAAYAWDARRCAPPAESARSHRGLRTIVVVAGVLMAGAGIGNAVIYPNGIRLNHSKGRDIPRSVSYDHWNTHSRVIAEPVVEEAPRYWGAGRFAPRTPIRWVNMHIDGEAGTFLTEFHGDDLSQLEWVKHDVTSLAYHLNDQADVAVIGVGGGRDILTALAFECRRVIGVELNQIFIDLLENKYREFSEIAGRPEVTLIHDDGRSYLTHSTEHFDLIQMSLIDTWASTSAGAMTLSENGLYTVEAWTTFLNRLRPNGCFTVSRWYSPSDLGETARLISLAVATLLSEGAQRPADHIILASAGRIGTLILSPSPFTPHALATIRQATQRFGFDLILCPGDQVPDERLARILQAGSLEELSDSTSDPVLDLSPPHDERPFFFSMVRPRAWLTLRSSSHATGGVISGNLTASNSLMAILSAVLILLCLSIVAPLVAFKGGHGLNATQFAASAFYFGAIGVGFMLIEIPLMQRFTVLLGHPVWSLAIVLFSMILSTGLGSLVSDRVPTDGARRLFALPCVIAVAILLACAAIQPGIDAALVASLPVRAAVTVLFTMPLGFLLGFCFPIGMRLVQGHSSRAMPWMWGINGGFGVLGSVMSVMVSMAWGISWSLLVGALCYFLLLAPIAVLRRR